MQQNATEKSLLDVAVIVAARNEERFVENCVESLLKAGQNQAEIWIIDDASTDHTGKLLQKYSDHIHILQGEGRGPGLARNTAAKKSTKSFLCFVDADASVDEEAILTLKQALLNASQNIAAVGGHQKVYLTAKSKEKKIVEFLNCISGVSDYIQSAQADTFDVSHNPSCLVMYRRDVFEKYGGFREDLWPCEDLELDIRLKKSGYGLLHTSKAVIYHARPSSWFGFFKMMYRYGWGHAQLVRVHGLTQKIHALVFLIPILVVASVTLIFLRSFQELFLYSVMAYILVVLGFMAQGQKLASAVQFSGTLLITSLTWFTGFCMGRFLNQGVANQ